MSSIHHFIRFSPLNKSAVGTAAQSMLTCGHAIVLVQQHGMSYKTGEKKKASDSPPIPPQAFGKQKAIAH